MELCRLNSGYANVNIEDFIIGLQKACEFCSKHPRLKREFEELLDEWHEAMRYKDSQRMPWLN